MISASKLLMISTVGVLMMGFAPRDHQNQKALAAESLANASAEATVKMEARGLESEGWGDDWTATNLYEHTADGDATVLQRFNLAAGYQRTGRAEEAAALYRGVALDGGYTWARPIADMNRPRSERLTARRMNLADESARRLGRIEAVQVAQGGAPFAGQAGVNTSATVGGHQQAQGVSDARAQQLDAANEVGPSF
jgi:hypothetical protein